MSNLINNTKNNPEILRAKRATAFKAFDIYKENVNYGLIIESEERHIEIVNWYNNCLNLDPIAIYNVPEEIRTYEK